MNSTEVLAEVAAAASVCERCPLHRSRRRAVPGEGVADAELLFIGEAPGYHENETGRPFVGASGQFLSELLASIGLKREAVFIGNVVKCRPPNNRDPEPSELAACRPYLDRQIAAIQPKVIVTLGRFSMGRFLPNARISAVHGKPFTVEGRLVVPMFHPAAALHRPELRATLLADFARLPALIAQFTPPPESPPPPDDATPPPAARQLSLF
jgi:DNA polymerase